MQEWEWDSDLFVLHSRRHGPSASTNGKLAGLFGMSLFGIKNSGAGVKMNAGMGMGF